MTQIFGIIEAEISRRDIELADLHTQLDDANSNNVYEQSRLQIEIAMKLRELEAIKRLYYMLKGGVE